jgi:hypothetical protein
MKKLLVAASAIGLIASTPAMAATGDIALSANVAAQCGVGNHMSGAAAAPGWDQSDIVVPLADGNGQFAGYEVQNRSFGNVWCNAPATVTLAVSALTTPVTVYDTDSFSNRFDIEVKTDAGVYVGQTQDFILSSAGETSGTKSVTGNTAGAFETGLQRFGGADSIKVLPSVRSGQNRRPVAGTYNGTITFTATVG